MAKGDKERFERIENALLVLAGGTVGRMGVGRTAAAAAKIPGFGYAAGYGLGRLALETPQGQELLADAEERGRQDRLRVERFMQDLQYGTKEKVKRSAKKRATSFNKAVSSGIKGLKASASYGKRGVLSNAKAAFRTATKAASARLKGKKMPKSGPARVAYKAVKGVYTDEILRRRMK